MVAIDELMTTHARRRAQQRAVPTWLLELLEQFGSARRAFYDAEVLMFDRKARARIRTELGCEALKRIDPFKNVYMVISDEGAVVTVARKFKRTKW